MNSVYLPVLIAVLNEIDQEADAYEDHRWFSSLDQRLKAVGAKHLGDKHSNRLIDAQKILDSPFQKMPLIAHALTEGS